MAHSIYSQSKTKMNEMTAISAVIQSSKFRRCVMIAKKLPSSNLRFKVVCFPIRSNLQGRVRIRFTLAKDGTVLVHQALGFDDVNVENASLEDQQIKVDLR